MAPVKTMARQPGLGNAFRLTELHHDLRDLSKLFSTEMYQKDACELMDLFAPESLFRDDEDLAEVGLGYRQSICMTIYGVRAKNTVAAEQGLGMPRSRT